MKRTLRQIAARTALAAGLVSAAIIGGAGVAGATPPGGTLYVAPAGHDTSGCRLQSHPCKTITYALSQAIAGSEIKVAAGSYPEQVLINSPSLDGVSIVGAGATETSIDPSSLATSDTDTDGGGPQLPIVDVAGVTGVSIQKLTVDGTPGQNQFPGSDCSVPDYVGIYYHDSTGAISNVTVTGVELPLSDFGCQPGLGIYVASDQGDTSAVTMSSDKVTAFDKNGITCDDPGTTCSISNTTVTGIGATALIAQNGIQVWGASATLSDDTVGACTYTGGYWDATAILVIDAGSFSLTGSKISGSDVGAYLLEDSAYSLQSGTSEGTWTVHDNTVKNDPNNGGGAPGDGFGDGIDVDSTASTTTVSNNTLKNDAGYGIGLYGAADVTVSHNTGTHDLDGLYIGGPGAVGATSSGDIVSANTFSSNSNDGILSDTTSTGNTFTGNMLKTNVDYDAQELGSGNTWTSNVCMPVHDENVGGLC